MKHDQYPPIFQKYIAIIESREIPNKNVIKTNIFMYCSWKGSGLEHDA